ncbi:MAG TPA: signal peptidase I [Fimbriimonadaceae bacterium]|nr:signal peptidase I [Fimbriimonadaceae bacterium]
MWPLLAQHDQSGGGLQQTIDTLARTPLSEIVVFVVLCTTVRFALFNYLKKTAPHRRHGIYPVAKILNEAMDAIVYAGVFVFMLIRPFAVQAFLIPSGSMLQTLWVNDFIVANKAIYRYSEPKVGDIIVFRPPVWALHKNQHDMDFIKRCQGVPGDVVTVQDGKLWRNGKPVDERYLSDSPGDGMDDASGNGAPKVMPDGKPAIGVDVKMDTDWKLVYYNGKGRPDLDGQYIPVLMKRGLNPDDPNCNYEIDGTCRKYAMGVDPNGDLSWSWVVNWLPPRDLSLSDLLYEKELKNAPPAAVPKGYVLMMGDNRNHSYDGRAWGLVPRNDVIGRSEFIWLPIGRWGLTRSDRGVPR